MKTAHVRIASVLILLCCSLFGQAQQTVATSTNVVVPTLVSFSGMLAGSNGKPQSGITGVTFSLYAEQAGGAPLWLETQNVQPDRNGNYTVMLGSTTSQGLPSSLFVSGQARWLQVQAQGQEPQPRIMLLSVPYALKAGDAQTLNGQTASSFMLAPAASQPGVSPSPQATNITGSGTKDYLSMFTGTTTIGNSKVYQDASGDIGIGTTSPTATLDVKGDVTVAASGTTLTASGGKTGVSGTGSSYGVEGSSPDGTGVYGASGSMGVEGSGAIGVYGTSPNFYGVEGTSTSGYGVYGTSSSLYGVVGESSTSTGVYGTSTSGTGVYGTSSSGVAAGVYGYNTGGGVGVNGYSAGTGAGVYGSSKSGDGVVGSSGGTAAGTAAVYGSTTGSTSNVTYGVVGNNSGTNVGVGVYGQDSTTEKESNTGSSLSGVYGAGVWGDGGKDWESELGNNGVIGTADDGQGVMAFNNSNSYYPLKAINYNSSGPLFNVSNPAGNFCNINGNGDINCTGSKSAIVPIDGGQRKVALYAIESPKNWFEDFGSAHLSNGAAVVTIDPEYAQTVNTELEYHVFLTPNGDCKGLYIRQRTPASFEVRELGGGTANIEFSYRIVALRKNYENIRLADHTNDPNPMKEVKALMEKRGTSGTPFGFQTPKLNAPKLPAATPVPRPLAQLNTLTPVFK